MAVAVLCLWLLACGPVGVSVGLIMCVLVWVCLGRADGEVVQELAKHPRDTERAEDLLEAVAGRKVH